MEDLNISPASFLSLVPPLLMMLISIYYITKKIDTDSVFLLIGSVVVFFTAIIFSILPYYFHSNNLPVTSISSYYSIVGIFAFLGSLLFAVGFLMLVLKMNENSLNKNSAKD